ncbi:TetR/AcrR family transcriptional regulator [Chitinilyticum piscinae]|nr:TetR/AcrR family transcriptional regulator [Chitinilyticum piscinae]
MRTQTDTREHLLATATAILLGKGFAAVGLAEILAAAGVPKGSFYHYFPSKEGFGVALLQRYFEHYDERLQRLLCPEQGSARDCLLAYFSGWQHCHSNEGAMPGCLVVKLAGEVADLSEPMREELARGTARIVARLAECLARGQQEGSIVRSLDAAQLASNLYSLWLGSALRSKVQHDAASQQQALVLTAQLLGQD